MMKYEYLKIIRNSKWKYGLLLGLVFYMIYVSSDILIEPTNMQKYLLLGFFLFEALFYNIVGDEERTESWQICLAYPITYRKNYLLMLVVLITVQLLVFLFGVVLYQLIENISISFLCTLYCIQILYLTGYCYSCYKSAKGYLAVMGSITVVNVTKTIVPVFLFFCIMNSYQWDWFFSITWNMISIFCIVVLLGLFIFLPYSLKRKVYREMVLSKLFPNLRFSPIQLQMETYKKGADKTLQRMFRLFDRKTLAYWQFCATLEVTLKLHFFVVILFLIFLIWFIDSYHILLIFAMIGCVLYFIYSFQQEYKKIEKVCILPNVK